MMTMSDTKTRLWEREVFEPACQQLAASGLGAKYGWVRDVISPDDLLNEALARLWEQRERYLDLNISQFRGLVYTTARNIAADEKRRKDRETEFLPRYYTELARPDTVTHDEQAKLFHLREELIAFPGVREAGWHQLANLLLKARKDSPIRADALAATDGNLAGLRRLVRRVVHRDWWAEDRIAARFRRPLSSVEAYLDVPFASRHEASTYLAGWLVAQNGEHLWCAAKLIQHGLLDHTDPTLRVAGATRLLTRLRPDTKVCVEVACPLAVVQKRVIGQNVCLSFVCFSRLWRRVGS